MRAPVLFAFVALQAAGCASQAASPQPPQRTFSFVADADAPGDEAYVCFGFDATPFVSTTVQSIRWTAPGGPVTLHHATLYAVPDEARVGPWPCDDMPNGVGMHIWARGGADLALPDDVGVRVPPSTRSFVVQAHALRTASGDAQAATVSIEASPSPPAHVAAWMSSGAPVPAIRPHATETSNATCTLAADVHVLRVWPHMHQIGAEISGAFARATGASEALVDVSPWAYSAQKTYEVDADATAGDALAVACRWMNPTTDYVLPGLKSTDEMCTFSLLVWPAENARWAGSCP